jgi:hypothetical protein
MSNTVKVLVWGTAQEGPCAYFRGGHLYDPVLADLGVEMRHISQVRFRPAKGWEDKPLLETAQAGKVELDTSDLEWADVVVFRRYYNTAMKCSLDGETKVCGFITLDETAAAAHQHKMDRQDDITRIIWPVVRDGYGGGIIYETDDNHWEIKPWNGYYPDVLAERDLIADMTRRADLVTVAVPALIPSYGRFNNNIRVIRNAVDSDLYVRDTPRGTYSKQRLVYYGSTARMRDYAGHYATGNRDDGDGFAYRAVEANRDLLTRVFIGTSTGSEAVIAKVFDEQTPYVQGIAAFSKALVESDGDIGIAPLGGDVFDRCKSELHWLEYSLAGMATVAQRFAGKDSPYSVIKEGVDGFLARTSTEWQDAVGRLARNPNLVRDIAATAEERVRREYDSRVRAPEWADAFRWAAEHPRGARLS